MYWCIGELVNRCHEQDNSGFPPPPLFWHPMLFTIWRRSQLESNDLKSLLQQPKGPFLCHHRPLETLNACKCKKKALLFSHFLLSQCPLATQGVLVLKFSISILMWAWDQHRCQMFCNVVQNYVPISDFATRSLTLKKPQKSQKCCKKYFFC